MLIIAVGFNSLGDPFTCKLKATSEELNRDNCASVVQHVVLNAGIEKDMIDELIVIENEDIVRKYEYAHIFHS